MGDSLAVLLLPGPLEGFVLEAHARALLATPRVVAAEPSRFRVPRLLREATTAGQARRMKFPGRPRLLVLYHLDQYPLARALCAREEEIELWYVAADAGDLRAGPRAAERLALDELVRERARQTLPVHNGTEVDDAPLRVRLHELEIINPRPFVPGRRLTS